MPAVGAGTVYSGFCVVYDTPTVGVGTEIAAKVGAISVVRLSVVDAEPGVFEAWTVAV